MRLVERLSELRDRQITEHAAPYLDPGEEVEHWARIRHPGRRREGFAYVTPRRFVVHWTGRSDGHSATSWDELRSWRVDGSRGAAPVLFVDAASDEIEVRLLVGTHGLARRATEFLNAFARHASRPGAPGPASSPIEITMERKSVLAKTKRGVVALVGITLVLLGMVLGPLPVTPGIPLIIAGLAVLASEFDWAKDALVWVRTKYRQTTQRLRSRVPEDDGGRARRADTE
ncbi:MAG: PGPGW domain-containing protein [Actinobacteria bacterium]|nr:PGPGW domain-containing protein [Actinomycetota bacterium]